MKPDNRLKALYGITAALVVLLCWLTYDEKEHINQWLNKQRTKRNNILGDKREK